jgi:[acyl-carrier-protein] S-malonyltransferase
MLRTFSSAPKAKCIVFPGQGSQYVGMASDIYAEFKAAKLVVEECEEVLGERLSEVMFKGPRTILKSTANAQPAILCHSIALLKVLQVPFF